MPASSSIRVLTNDQKSFFDRYGDDILYGFFDLSDLRIGDRGSGRLFHRAGRTRRLRLLQRLLDLTQKANHAPSLDAARQPADRRRSTGGGDHSPDEQEDYDQGIQISFGLVLDQARFAISSRRAVLIGHGNPEAKPGAQSTSLRLEPTE